MNRKPEHHLPCPTEFAVATCRDGEFGGRTALRRILSQLGLHADTTQEDTLLELIHRSHRQKQYAHA